MFELAVRQFSKLDLLGGFYADNVNDGMWGNVSHPSPLPFPLIFYRNSAVLGWLAAGDC